MSPRGVGVSVCSCQGRVLLPHWHNMIGVMRCVEAAGGEASLEHTCQRCRDQAPHAHLTGVRFEVIMTAPVN